MRIKNWPEFQHYTKRRPPWIKLHRSLLDDKEWFKLDPVASKVLVMCWLIASEDREMSGNLPALEDLAFRLRISDDDLKSVLLGLNHWIELDDGMMLAPRLQHAEPETETERETEPERESETHTDSRVCAREVVDPFFPADAPGQPEPQTATTDPQEGTVADFILHHLGPAYQKLYKRPYKVAAVTAKVDGLLSEGSSRTGILAALRVAHADDVKSKKLERGVVKNLENILDSKATVDFYLQKLKEAPKPTDRCEALQQSDQWKQEFENGS